MIVPGGNSSGNFLLAQIPNNSLPKTFFLTYTLSANDAAVLNVAAADDASCYLYNATVSFLSALSGLQSYDAAWAVTKLYYSVFYVARAALCRAGQLLFHVEKEGENGFSQYELKLKVGEQAVIVRDTPSTHKLVTRRFKQSGYPAFMMDCKLMVLIPWNG